MSLSDRLHLSQEVVEARKTGQPIVALESTIITHGMPHPQNLETARQVEETVRQRGAVPATIAIQNGRILLGLENDQLDALACARDVMKLSRADLAYALSEKRTGSTTVAATMICAHLAGILVFATGGIGGVHRGAAESFDISADLEELAATPVITVCAGAKAILDIEKTLEVLETKGVPVIGYGCDTFPAFWSRESGLAAPLRQDSARAIADHACIRTELGLTGGMLVANPVPQQAEIPAGEINTLIDTALADASAAGVTGKAVTPYLLQKMFELSDGRTLETNVALVLNNAALAADIAVALKATVDR